MPNRLLVVLAGPLLICSLLFGSLFILLLPAIANADIGSIVSDTVSSYDTANTTNHSNHSNSGDGFLQNLGTGLSGAVESITVHITEGGSNSSFLFFIYQCDDVGYSVNCVRAFQEYWHFTGPFDQPYTYNLGEGYSQEKFGVDTLDQSFDFSPDKYYYALFTDNTTIAGTRAQTSSIEDTYLAGDCSRNCGSAVDMAFIFHGSVSVDVSPPEPTCCSSVLFLPGIMSSLLYEGGEKRWEPDGESDVQRLYLDENGISINNVQADNVIGTFDGPLLFNIDIYKSFLADLADKKQSGYIANYDAYAYDWRLSLEDILEDGDLIDRLHELVLTSKTGKVTIVTHSNGGLLAKALVNKLEEEGDSEAATLIDQLVFVGVPQLGTPQAIGALLHGYDSGIQVRYSEARARDFAHNAPFAYQLLPFSDYYNNSGFSVSTPLVTFQDGEATRSFIDEYGYTISNSSELYDFLRAKEGRTNPSYSDLDNPTIANSTLLQNAINYSSNVGSSWQAPDGIKVHQIAGVGELTLAGIEYKTINKCNGAESQLTGWYCPNSTRTLGYSPVRVVDGDATVVEPSALAMSDAAENVTRWWVNLKEYNEILFDQVSKPILRTEHKDMLEVADLRSLVFDNIIGTSTNYEYTYLSSTKPNFGTESRLSFILHSPLSLSYTESDGTTVNEQNPHGKYSKYNRYGEVQIIDIFEGEPGTLTMNGEATGSFTLEIEEVSGNEIISQTTYSAIPSSTSTIVTIEVSGGTMSETDNLVVDYDGDSTTDFTLAPSEGEEVSLPSEPPVEPILTELIDQLIIYIDTNVTNKQIKKLLTKQLKKLKKIHDRQEKLKIELPQLAHLFKHNSAFKTLIKVLDKQLDVYVKLKRLEQDTATEIKRLLKVIENKL